MQDSPGKQKTFDIFGNKRISSPELSNNMKTLDKIMRKNAPPPKIDIMAPSPQKNRPSINQGIEYEHPKPVQSKLPERAIYNPKVLKGNSNMNPSGYLKSRTARMDVLEELSKPLRKSNHQMLSETMIIRPKQSNSHSGASIDDVYSVGNSGGHKRGLTYTNLANYMSQETLNPSVMDWKIPGINNNLQESVLLDEGMFSRKHSSGGNKMFDQKPNLKYEAVRDFLVKEDLTIGQPDVLKTHNRFNRIRRCKIKNAHK